MTKKSINKLVKMSDDIDKYFQFVERLSDELCDEINSALPGENKAVTCNSAERINKLLYKLHDIKEFMDTYIC